MPTPPPPQGSHVDAKFNILTLNRKNKHSSTTQPM
jgi:hypothetical protein